MQVPAVLASLNARLPALCGGGAAASSLRALQIACLLVVLALVAGVLDFPDIIDDDTMLVQVLFATTRIQKEREVTSIRHELGSNRVQFLHA